jgi:phosphoglycerate dehydrogenase-like enzyme
MNGPRTVSKHWRIGLVGYGEVGRILAEDLRAAGVENLSSPTTSSSAPMPMRRCWPMPRNTACGP